MLGVLKEIKEKVGGNTAEARQGQQEDREGGEEAQDCSVQESESVADQ
jgi:hypothetical protein